MAFRDGLEGKHNVTQAITQKHEISPSAPVCSEWAGAFGERCAPCYREAGIAAGASAIIRNVDTARARLRYEVQQQPSHRDGTFGSSAAT